MKITRELEAELIMVMNDYWDSYIRGDMETWASYLSENYWNIGTNEEEVWTSKQEIIDFTNRVLEQLVGMVQIKDRLYSFMPVDPYTMVHEFGNLYIKSDKGWNFYSKMRLSSLLHKTDSGWKILHQHGSYPDSRLEKGEFFGFENLLKENTELRDAVKRRTIELELKNRELEIEAAVERVRAQSLAMYETRDLAKVNQELFNQVTKLNIEGFTGVAIYLVDEEEAVTVWDLSSPGSMGDVNSHAFKYDSKKYPVMGEFVPIWRAADQEYFILDYPRERLLLAADEMEHAYPAMAELVRTAVNSGTLKHQWNAAGRLSNGMLSLDLMNAPTEEVKTITLKMAGAFNLAYQRFLDLQKAEAQTVRAERDLIEIKEARKKAEDTLTELLATQKQLIQSEKMASLGELTAGIAHEIQNPLNFVNNFSELSNELMDEMKEGIVKGEFEEVRTIADDIKQNLEKISHHGRRADAIVKGMLQHSQSGKGVKEPTDINALADEYLRLSYHGLRAKDKNFNATIKTNFDHSIGKLNIIPQDMGRVLLNLFTNAFYAVNEKKLQEKNGFEPTVTVTTWKQADHLEGWGISVSDNGNGIPQNIVDKIFQPFFTTKPTGQGTGLGLSLAYDIVKAHSGELKVETICANDAVKTGEESQGSIFTILLPVK